MTSSTEALNAEIEQQEILVTTYRGAQLRAEADAKAWKLRAELLEAKLATAHREGMEAAAVIADGFVVSGNDKFSNGRDFAARGISRAIRETIK